MELWEAKAKANAKKEKALRGLQPVPLTGTGALPIAGAIHSMAVGASATGASSTPGGAGTATPDGATSASASTAPAPPKNLHARARASVMRSMPKEVVSSMSMARLR